MWQTCQQLTVVSKPLDPHFNMRNKEKAIISRDSKTSEQKETLFRIKEKELSRSKASEKVSNIGQT